MVIIADLTVDQGRDSERFSGFSFGFPVLNEKLYSSINDLVIEMLEHKREFFHYRSDYLRKYSKDE